MATTLISYQIDFNAVGKVTDLKGPAARMRFTRLVKAIESGALIEKSGESSQGGPQKATEVSKKRKKTMTDGDDSATDQDTLLQTDKPASTAENVSDNSKGGKIALGDKAEDTLAARKSAKPSPKKAATNKNKTGISNLASSETKSFKSMEVEAEVDLPKVGAQVPSFRMIN